jgi:hypothetical protein
MPRRQVERLELHHSEILEGPLSMAYGTIIADRRKAIAARLHRMDLRRPLEIKFYCDFGGEFFSAIRL